MTLLTDLRETGYTVLEGADLDERRPWELVRRILDAPPEMVEHQIIRAVRGGRSFASTDVETPLHADLQLHWGRPADLQIMVCHRPAARGGESLLADMFGALRDLAIREAPLVRALCTAVRRFPFISGAIERPTLSFFGDRLALLHAPVATPGDPHFDRVAELARKHAARVRLERGQVLVADNHRVLHGRTSFDDEKRELHRYLVWTRDPRPTPDPLNDIARAAMDAARRRGEPWSFDPAPAFDPETKRTLTVALRMLAGESPGALARTEGIPEADLYRIRDLVTSAGAAALAGRKR